MYYLALTLQCFTIAMLFAECWVVMKNWKSALHSYLFLGCATTLVNSVGYLLELLARSEEAYFTATRFAYLGRVWTTFAMILFVAELTRVRLPKPLKIALAVFSAATYVLVLTTKQTGLYYKKVTAFSMYGDFPRFYHTSGPWHHLYTAEIALSFFYILYLLLRTLHREKEPVARKRFLMVFYAIVVQGTLVLIELLKVLPVSNLYDVTMLSFPIAAVFMLLAIFRYDLLDTENLARSYVVDELSEAIIATDANGTVQFYNKPAQRLFPGLMMDPQRVVDSLRELIDECRMLERNGRVYQPEATQLSQGSKGCGTLYSLADETEHIRYMDELREQKQIADAANRAKSNFLASMSHEIRTPINAILGMDEMILRESGEEQIASYAGDIQNAGRTLLALINDILDFSKVEEGKMEIIPTQYDLSSVVNDLANMLRPRAEKKGLRFVVEVDEQTPRLLFGDEIRIRQCALNLLTNAVKYTEKGTVTLRVDWEKRADDKISLRVRVSDTGIGMKPEDMKRLFSPFERIEEKRNRTIEGTGLGMSITKGLLELMDSRLDVESVYGEGSVFSFAVEQTVVKWEPVGSLARRCEPGAARKAYRELFHAPDARVLVVDDTPVNLAVIRGLLKKTRVQVVTVESGREALARAAREPFDVYFIDHMMPGMDGVETLRELRKLPQAQGAPCVALTANAVSGAREMYMKAGFTDYLSKPVDGETLEKLLMSLLPKEKLRDPAEDDADAAEEPADFPTVLVVDDDPMSCAVAEKTLGKSFRVESCRSGEQAPERARELKPALVLLDINLGGASGFDVLRALRSAEATSGIPVVFLTGESDEAAEIEGFRGGAADFVRKPIVPEVLLRRTARIIALDRLQRGLRREVKRQTLRAEHLTREMMLALSKAVDAKDHYTNGHSERVAAYAAEIARRMGKSALEQEHIYEMGLLHDVGKIGVPEEIINKTSRLTDEEFEKIKRHTVVGGDILRQITEMPELSSGARSHHERYDGSGYPDGLKGTDIPEAARIICLADCYDAMTSTRTYSKPKPQEKVRAEIARCAGTQFDPEIAKVLLAMIDEDTDYVMNERTADIRVWKGSDRLWSTSGEPEEEPPAAPPRPEEEPPAALPDWLDGVEEIDTAEGLRHCGTAETYLETLTIFAKNAASGADEIEGYWRARDAANATVKVHALKSMSRTIGAQSLGALAEKLELAGKAGDEAALFGGLDELLRRFRALGGQLSPLCAPAGEERDDESLPPISDEELREGYESLRELAANLDADNACRLLDCFGDYRLPAAERERVGALRHAVEEFDWDRVNEILGT
ncbi:MAG: response regulator [Oscillospiraceae bacterium]|nr:response regulator [Oscillospiraceae bacterium]